jgi:O-6-methylguanine DNA methyltransferase
MKGVQQLTLATTLLTPLGTLRLAASPRGLCQIDFVTRAGRDQSQPGGSAQDLAARQARAHLEAARRQLREYFDGRRSAFDLSLDLQGTAHQRRVWQVLQRIPFGQTLSYGAVARRLARLRPGQNRDFRGSGAARAVGRACSTNPVPVVVPCHRVIGDDGALRGYNAGVWRKRLLLKLEASSKRVDSRRSVSQYAPTPEGPARVGSR